MTNFNKYAFLEDLKNQLITEIEKYDVDYIDEVHPLISEIISNQSIYHYDSFLICIELNAFDFRAYDIECNNISELAFAALHEFVYEKLDFSELEEICNNKVK
jgi:hypothetical protein